MCTRVWASVCIHVCSKWWMGWSMEPSGRCNACVCVWVWQALSIFKLRGVSAVLFFSSAGWKPLGWISSFNTAGRLCLHWLQSSVLDANAVHLCFSAHQSLRSIVVQGRHKVLFFSGVSVLFLLLNWWSTALCKVMGLISREHEGYLECTSLGWKHLPDVSFDLNVFWPSWHGIISILWPQT